ncbi:MAG: alpha/beta fold hydrolase [Phormidesmis sp.]
MVTPTKQEISQAQQAIEAHLEVVRSRPDQRPRSHPYYRFHPPGKPVQGTVIMFHGFSMSPHQLWRLADYLFNNGFNFYQVPLAGHDQLNPHKNWPQIDLRPEYVKALLQKVQQDPVLQAAVMHKAAVGSVAVGQQEALLDRLFQVAPEMQDFAAAIAQPKRPDFDQYFISSHEAFLQDAQQRLNELSALPSPIYAVGLSVGGAVALGLAEKNASRIKRVVAYAPLLKIYGAQRRQYVQLTGPLDINETGWDPNLQFPVGALTAADYFGSEVRLADNLARLKGTPVFMVLTENEDATDIATNEQAFADMGGQAAGNWLYKYPAAAMVPHAMIDPTEVSQGMSNLFWQSLYQETLRFLTKGEVNIANLKTLAQDDSFSLVPSVG